MDDDWGPLAKSIFNRSNKLLSGSSGGLTSSGSKKKTSPSIYHSKNDFEGTLNFGGSLYTPANGSSHKSTYSVGSTSDPGRWNNLALSGKTPILGNLMYDSDITFSGDAGDFGDLRRNKRPSGKSTLSGLDSLSSSSRPKKKINFGASQYDSEILFKKNGKPASKLWKGF